jgi:signal transduction histidine kinase
VNLADNAIKYSPDGGPVEVALEAGEKTMRFVVRDRGLGIPNSERTRIFKKSTAWIRTLRAGSEAQACTSAGNLCGGWTALIWVEPNGAPAPHSWWIPLAEPAPKRVKPNAARRRAARVSPP